LASVSRMHNARTPYARRDVRLHFLVNALRGLSGSISGDDEWDPLSLLEKRAFVTRLALARAKEILTFPLPHADDVCRRSLRVARYRELMGERASMPHRITPIGNVRKSREGGLR
jgi:hypothetical protein